MADQWNQASSDMYRQLSMVAVPSRQEQITTMLALLPFGKDDAFHAVELASGEGLLAFALLHAFPKASLLALDLEESMRASTAARTQSFGERCTVASFDMVANDWYGHLEGADVVMSSLCIHHLDGPQKWTLFAAVAERLSPRGVFLIADLIQAQTSPARELFAASWDEASRKQSIELTGTLDKANTFAEEHWNYYRYPEPFDKPSPLFDQLVWLKAADFATVDCFWLKAGHAIYGGYKGGQTAKSLPYDEAKEAARLALASTL
jgi:SAM-dependent methyltransferase